MAIASIVRFALAFYMIISVQHIPTLANKKAYIVYLGTHSHGLHPTELDAEIATESHYMLLSSLLGSDETANESILYSYNKYINGFVANLSPDEVEKVKASSYVVSVIENQLLELQTTQSWRFLGLEQNNSIPSDSLWSTSDYGNDIIIGNLDTGVWPESESFNDKEFEPIPSRWKGACMQGEDPTFKCNKKLIGSKYFYTPPNETQILTKSSLSPRDNVGHGTHTLSIAGGNFVKGVSAFGFGSGIAKGGSPKARVASYKICWGTNCWSSDTLAAFEAAIGDGVDVLSISLASNDNTLEYKSDVIAIGSFHAVRQGIVVVASAGNFGPTPDTVRNIAPWMFTVGASTLDRRFPNRVSLGNSTLSFKGTSIHLSTLHSNKQFHPLIDASSAPANSLMANKSRYCEVGSLDPMKVEGNIVFCQGKGINDTYNMLTSYNVVQAAGGVGMIFSSDSLITDEDVSIGSYMFSSHISYKDGMAILDYINSTANATASISEAVTEVPTRPAPMMASFSSRGPSSLRPQILKPDVTAPGVNIIAAWTGMHGPYHFASGTSMSCPHVAGIVGLLKSLYPDWSPAAIRSAIMTTATTFDNGDQKIMDYNGQQATPFAYGAGHINANAAANPGLIYNLTENDYLNFLCSFYTENDLKLFTTIPYKCKRVNTVLDFNYPSITVSNFTTLATLNRTVTNVGNPGTYEATIIAPEGISINVVPSKLEFNRTGEEQTFSLELKVNGNKTKQGEYLFGSLMWNDGVHNVRSPIAVEFV